LPKKTFELAEKAEAILVVQVKGNQKELYKQVASAHGREKPLEVHEDETTKGHGRLEKRKYEVYEAKDILKKWAPEWPYIRYIIKVTRSREVLKKGSQPSLETSYYLTNGTSESATLYATIIRQHWGIENKSNHVRDVAFQEDNGIRRINPGIFARIISLAYNSLSASGCNNFKESLYKNALSFNHLLGSLSCF